MQYSVYWVTLGNHNYYYNLKSDLVSLNLELSTQPTETPDLSVNVFQTELSDRPSRTVTLSDQTTVVFIGTLLITYCTMTIIIHNDNIAIIVHNYIYICS